MNKERSPGWWYLSTKYCTWGLNPRAQQMVRSIFRGKDWIMYNCLCLLIISFAHAAHPTVHTDSISILPGTQRWLLLLITKLRHYNFRCAIMIHLIMSCICLTWNVMEFSEHLTHSQLLMQVATLTCCHLWSKPDVAISFPALWRLTSKYSV